MTSVRIYPADVFGWQQPVLTKTLTAPPGTPTPGDRYLIPASPTGVWATHATHITTWAILDPVGAPTTYGWAYSIPSNGFYVYIMDENLRYRYNGTAWISDAVIGEANTLTSVGTAGTSIVSGKVGVDLQVKAIKAASTKVAVADSTGDKTVSVDVVQANIDHNLLLNYNAANHANVSYDSGSKIITIVV